MIAVGVAVYWWASRGESAAGIVPSAVAATAAETAAATAPVPATPGAGAVSSRAAPSAGVVRSSPAAPAPAPAYEAAADTNPPPDSAPVSDEDPGNVRAASIRQAGEGKGSPDELALLSQSLRSDPITRNRLLAVNAVRTLGADPTRRAWALGELRTVQAQDRSPLVVSHAADAIAALSKP